LRTVLDRCNEVFDFAQRAKILFKSGSIDDKRAILRFTGSNLVLKDKILTIEPQKPLFFIQRTLRSDSGRKFMIEPTDSGKLQHRNGTDASGLAIWCALVDDVRTSFLKHSDQFSSENVN
jgi:hypothetical protein